MSVIASRSERRRADLLPAAAETGCRKILIVEDDKNINKLMALSIGKGFEMNQIYDGGEAVDVRQERTSRTL